MISLCIKINDDNVLDYLVNEINKTTISKVTCKRHKFKVYENVIVHFQGDDFESFFDCISTVVTNAITLFFEDKLIKDLIDLNYFYFNAPDKKVIFEEYKLLKNNRQKNITDNSTISSNNSLFSYLIFPAVKEYIVSNRILLLGGFINFRLKNYLSILENVVDDAVNSFIIEKEYTEFVSLLKMYINSQSPNCQMLHLIYSNESSILLDENKDIINISDDIFKAKYLSDITFSSNDYALNTLLNLLPKKIYIHLINNYIDEFIQTLILIFENRIEICTDCDICNLYKNRKTSFMRD